MKTIYLAAAFARRPEIARYAAALRRDGITVVSSWHDGIHDVTPEAALAYCRGCHVGSNGKVAA